MTRAIYSSNARGLPDQRIWQAGMPLEPLVSIIPPGSLVWYAYLDDQGELERMECVRVMRNQKVADTETNPL